MGADLYLLDAQGDELDYFRDSYGAAMLWEFGLSWWQDVIPMLDANQRLDAKQAGRLLALLKENEPIFAANLARRPSAEQERRRQQYAELKAMLSEAMERGTAILCSL